MRRRGVRRVRRLTIDDDESGTALLPASLTSYPTHPAATDAKLKDEDLASYPHARSPVQLVELSRGTLLGQPSSFTYRSADNLARTEVSTRRLRLRRLCLRLHLSCIRLLLRLS